MATAPKQEKATIAPIVGPDDPRRFTDSGIEVKNLYTDEDVAEGLPDRLGEPADYPFTRGIHKDMYRGRLWTMRQYAGYATAAETNQRFRYLPEPAMRLTTDLFAYCRERIPKWNTISISGYHMREKGCSAVQEVGFTLANAIAYVQAAIDAGLEVDEFAPRLAFFFNGHNNVFQEVAKFPAVRRMWAPIMRERFGSQNPRSQTIRFHT